MSGCATNAQAREDDQSYGTTVGGDWGSFISAYLAYGQPEQIIGIHINLIPSRREPPTFGPDDPKVAGYCEELDHWQREETGYSTIQATKPQTLAYASPTHLLVWPPGSSKNSARGATATGTSNAASRRTICSPTSCSTGSAAPSAARSGRTSRAFTRAGHCQATDASKCRPPTSRSRKTSCTRRE